VNRRTITKTLLSTLASGAMTAPRALAQRPMAPSPSTSASASTITLTDVPGAALALSSDGTMVAGVTENETFCVWDVATFEAIAQSEPLPELRIIDDESVTWAPDGRAVAWSLNAPRLMRDSDIYVFDVESAAITNLTREPSKEEDAASLMEATGIEFGVDMFPVWSATGDGILFTRTPWGENAPRETRLMRISPEGGMQRRSRCFRPPTRSSSTVP
jgi:WD40 repeat protein